MNTPIQIASMNIQGKLLLSEAKPRSYSIMFDRDYLGLLHSGGYIQHSLHLKNYFFHLVIQHEYNGIRCFDTFMF